MLKCQEPKPIQGLNAQQWSAVLLSRTVCGTLKQALIFSFEGFMLPLLACDWFQVTNLLENYRNQMHNTGMYIFVPITQNNFRKSMLINTKIDHLVINFYFCKCAFLWVLLETIFFFFSNYYFGCYFI